MTKDDLYRVILANCEASAGFCMDRVDERKALADILTESIWTGSSFIGDGGDFTANIGVSDIVAGLEHIAQAVHNARHAKSWPTWEECPMSTCVHAQKLLHKGDYAPGGEGAR